MSDTFHTKNVKTSEILKDKLQNSQNNEILMSDEIFRESLMMAATSKTKINEEKVTLSVLATKIREKIVDSTIPDIEEVMESRLNKNSIVGDDPGVKISLDHLDERAQTI